MIGARRLSARAEGHQRIIRVSMNLDEDDFTNGGDAVPLSGSVTSSISPTTHHHRCPPVSPSLLHHRDPSSTRSLTTTASLAVGGTTVTFYRCKPFVRSSVRLLACSPGIRINPRPVPLSYRTPTCVIDRTELENPDAQIERVATKITLLLHHSPSSYRIHSICHILGFSTCF